MSVKKSNLAVKLFNTLSMSETNSSYQLYIEMGRKMSESIVSNIEFKELVRSLELNEDARAKKKIQFYTKQVQDYLNQDLKVN